MQHLLNCLFWPMSNYNIRPYYLVMVLCIWLNLMSVPSISKAVATDCSPRLLFARDTWRRHTWTQRWSSSRFCLPTMCSRRRNCCRQIHWRPSSYQARMWVWWDCSCNSILCRCRRRLRWSSGTCQSNSNTCWLILIIGW